MKSLEEFVVKREKEGYKQQWGRHRQTSTNDAKETTTTLGTKSIQNKTAGTQREEEVSATPTSFVQKILTSLSSLFGTTSVIPPSSAPSSSLPRPLAASLPETTVETAGVAIPPTNMPPRPSSLQKRIMRRQIAIEKLKQELEAATMRLHSAEQKRNSLQPPLPDQEYQRAQVVVATCREMICSHLARHMKERHQHLIAQYQALDAKTDLTKPHDWYPYARLDKRKIIYHGG
jgi:hypothetical protein